MGVHHGMHAPNRHAVMWGVGFQQRVVSPRYCEAANLFRNIPIRVVQDKHMVLCVNATLVGQHEQRYRACPPGGGGA
jgi:hypothetical protein